MIVHVLGRQEWLFLLHREHAAKYDPKKARSLDTIVTTHYMKGINRRDVLEKHDLLGILVVSTGQNGLTPHHPTGMWCPSRP